VIDLKRPELMPNFEFGCRILGMATPKPGGGIRPCLLVIWNIIRCQSQGIPRRRQGKCQGNAFIAP